MAPPPGPGPKPGDPGDGLQRSLSELAGRARVESGLAHPYHSQLASALSRSWHVENTIEARGASGYLADVRESLQTFVRVWAKLADGYGTTGAPALVDGGSDRLRELAGLPPGPARDALARTEVNRQLARVWSEGHVATVRVVQDRDGRLKSARLVAPSIDPELDREALAAVPAAVAQLAAPAEVLGGREELATLWEFEIEVSITPPVPVVGVEFDEALGHVDLRLPLDRRIWKRVRLVAIE